MDHLVTFGCEVVFYTEKLDQDSKLSPSGLKGIFLGYQEGHRNYRIWLVEKNCIKFTHNLRFIKDSFPGITFGTDPLTIDASIFDIPEEDKRDILSSSVPQSGDLPDVCSDEELVREDTT
jgi:hypothetical protein